MAQDDMQENKIHHNDLKKPEHFRAVNCRAVIVDASNVKIAEYTEEDILEANRSIVIGLTRPSASQPTDPWEVTDTMLHTRQYNILQGFFVDITRGEANVLFSLWDGTMSRSECIERCANFLDDRQFVPKPYRVMLTLLSFWDSLRPESTPIRVKWRYNYGGAVVCNPVWSSLPLKVKQPAKLTISFLDSTGAQAPPPTQFKLELQGTEESHPIEASIDGGVVVSYVAPPRTTLHKMRFESFAPTKFVHLQEIQVIGKIDDALGTTDSEDDDGEDFFIARRQLAPPVSDDDDEEKEIKGDGGAMDPIEEENEAVSQQEQTSKSQQGKPAQQVPKGSAANEVAPLSWPDGVLPVPGVFRTLVQRVDGPARLRLEALVSFLRDYLDRIKISTPGRYNIHEKHLREKVQVEPVTSEDIGNIYVVF
eukprot:TRINITY_DN6358_c0_g1_i2.p1 TRINITY_DN6358_c0_g1~~TRINITY_DN6358_c0_g1_i2.p1  ORF type:complete len:422 (+),score=60.16 TRINITY_DN6358_c0_g1_i2:666-1931(+)